MRDKRGELLAVRVAQIGTVTVLRLRRTPQAHQEPVLAIGGVKVADVSMLAEEGASGIAVVSAIMAAEDPEAAARAFIAAWTREGFRR